MSTQHQYIETVDYNKLILLNPDLPTEQEEMLYKAYRRFIVGQDKAVRYLVKTICHANILNGQLRPIDKPAGIFFVFGTTGSGKTYLSEVTAMLLFGSFKALTKIKGGDFQLSHQISTLTGAPPGYIGFDSPPFLTQEKLDRFGFDCTITDPVARRYVKFQAKSDLGFKRKHELNAIINTFNNSAFSYQAQMVRTYNDAMKELPIVEERISKCIDARDKIAKYRPELKDFKPPVYDREKGYPSVLNIDETEKADEAVRRLLLDVLDKAELSVTGNNPETISFKNALIFLTSNIGQEKMLEITGGKKYGFESGEIKSDEQLEEEVNKIRKQILNYGYEQLSKTFAPEFLGRVGEENTFAFGPLTPAEQYECLNSVMLPLYNKELEKRFPVVVSVSKAAQKFMIEEARSPRKRVLGMRSLISTLKSFIKAPIGSLMAQSQASNGIIPGDKVMIDLNREEKNKLSFFLERNPELNQKALHSLQERIDEQEALNGPSGLCTFILGQEDDT